MTKEEYFKDWLKVIDENILLNVVNQINSLYKIKKCEPSYHDIFKAFHITPYNDLSIIFLLQDPYPQIGVSTGIALGNKIDKKELSPSLQVVKEAVIDFEVPHNILNFDPTLEEWSKQGVLLLNSALTVEANRPNSHAFIWRPFIKSLLINLSELNPGLIYVLWGNEAKTFKKYINSNMNIIYTMPHPAYYARNNMKLPHKFFIELNNIIYSKYNKRINWYKEK